MTNAVLNCYLSARIQDLHTTYKVKIALYKKKTCAYNNEYTVYNIETCSLLLLRETLSYYMMKEVKVPIFYVGILSWVRSLCEMARWNQSTLNTVTFGRNHVYEQ